MRRTSLQFAILALFACALPVQAQITITPGTTATPSTAPVSTGSPSTAPVNTGSPVTSTLSSANQTPASDYSIIGPGIDANDRSGLMGGGSFYFLKPYATNNVAYDTITGIGTTSPQSTNTNFENNVNPAFAVWLGYAGPEGFGGRVRWFNFDQNTDPLNVSLTNPAAATTKINASPNLPNLPLPPGGSLFVSPGLLLSTGFGKDVMSFSSSLDITALDFEFTYGWTSGPLAILLGGGVRYLHMSQGYQATLANSYLTASESQNLTSTHDFNGVGPMLDLQATWKIGQTNLAVFVNGRGSLLAGSSSQSTAYSQHVSDPNGLTNGGFFPVNTTVTPSVSTSTNTILPVLEVEVGMEYGVQLGASYFSPRRPGQSDLLQRRQRLASERLQPQPVRRTILPGTELLIDRCRLRRSVVVR